MTVCLAVLARPDPVRSDLADPLRLVGLAAPSRPACLPERSSSKLALLSLRRSPREHRFWPTAARLCRQPFAPCRFVAIADQLWTFRPASWRSAVDAAAALRASLDFAAYRSSPGSRLSAPAR